MAQQFPDNQHPVAPRATNSPGPAGSAEARVLRSEELFAGARVVRIQHGDEQYRLLITRNNRLILQK